MIRLRVYASWVSPIDTRELSLRRDKERYPVKKVMKSFRLDNWL